jgi:hypothetical protein
LNDGIVYTEPSMATATIDTLKYANTLKSAGVPEGQAEAFTSALDDVFRSNFKTVVSVEEQRLSNAELRNELKSMFETIRLEMKNGFELLRAEIKETEQRINANMDAKFAAVSARIDATNASLGVRIDATNADLRVFRTEFSHWKWVVFSVLLMSALGLIRLFFLKSVF